MEYQKDLGFGICGHKNSYSTAVKVGNWVEDSIGAELAAGGHGGESREVSLTETQARYVDPSTFDGTDKLGPEVQPSDLLAVRSGVSYEVMFPHGKDLVAIDAGKEDRRSSVSKLAHSNQPTKVHDILSGKANPNATANTLAREKLKEQARAKRLDQSYLTTKEVTLNPAGSKLHL